MKDILIISHFVDFPFEKGNDRFCYIAEKLRLYGNQVEIVTSDYIHVSKSYRHKDSVELLKLNYKTTILHEPSYLKNVSLKRVYSHYVFGKNLESYLLGRDKPDIIYCAVPSLNVAKVAAKYAKKNNIRFIIDVQDLWPEAFKMVFNVPVLSDALFYPMKKQADYIYDAADEIIAVSNTYMNRALKVNRKCKEGHSIFLGTELASFDSLMEKNKFIGKPETEIWLTYVGTLGHSYDLTCVIDALKILEGKGIKNIKFIAIGDGPLKFMFENYAKEKGVYVEFIGRLEYGKMAGILKSCDIAINPIKAGSAGSIINKVGDYSAAGLPVLNTQECTEYRNLVDEYQIGLNCQNNNAEDLATKLVQLYENETLRKTMGKNSRKLAQELFDRKQTYMKIIDLIG
ncbi:glycosyltransferase family 4 protein [Tissierella sp. MSJ-40]|uniref:Glycosyltransferase family 4 protein n=1 Tax=Tissierella simiarum TaxID=2841534 RepID=A0ABS6E1Q8_9FIRM|nr:glycosyltransferase family 4 protein [Tissierella simiarum]MBU5436822.1 glycosyltransferase family 4 protein [Tissierella simiarum]